MVYRPNAMFFFFCSYSLTLGHRPQEHITRREEAIVLRDGPVGIELHYIEKLDGWKIIY